MKIEFEKFVNSQPQDEKIYHDDGWEGCAVGEFAKSIGMSAREVANILYVEYGSNSNSTITFLHMEHKIDVPHQMKPTIMDMLNLGKFNFYTELAHEMKLHNE